LISIRSYASISKTTRTIITFDLLPVLRAAKLFSNWPTSEKIEFDRVELSDFKNLSVAFGIMFLWGYINRAVITLGFAGCFAASVKGKERPKSPFN
jgi:hypothetical protein